MMVRTLFNGEVHVHYRQIYVWSDFTTSGPLLEEAFAGQANGLCGAASPGALFMVTGLHTGMVGFSVELHDEVPPIDDTWEEAVEVSFTPSSSRVALVQWAGGVHRPLGLEHVCFRARYCATGMNEGRSADTRSSHEPHLDRYLLQFWPAPPGPDRILKQTSEVAAYWHRAARQRPSPPSLEERAEAERRAQQERHLRLQNFHDQLHWGGHAPSERLRHVGGNVVGLAALDRELVDAIAEADPAVQRGIARWAAHRAYDSAGLASLDWVSPALDALDRGEELPPPFNHPAEPFRLLLKEERVFYTLVSPPGGGARNVSQQHAAVPALIGAAAVDPLRAAIDALYAAAVTFGSDYRMLLDDVRRAFPTITRRLE